MWTRAGDRLTRNQGMGSLIEYRGVRIQGSGVVG
jgi:hypothetical protein